MTASTTQDCGIAWQLEYVAAEVSVLLQLFTDRAPYSEHIVQVDLGDSATDHVKNITPDLQQERDSSCSNPVQQKSQGR